MGEKKTQKFGYDNFFFFLNLKGRGKIYPSIRKIYSLNTPGRDFCKAQRKRTNHFVEIIRLRLTGRNSRESTLIALLC